MAEIRAEGRVNLLHFLMWRVAAKALNNYSPTYYSVEEPYTGIAFYGLCAGHRASLYVEFEGRDYISLTEDTKIKVTSYKQDSTKVWKFWLNYFLQFSHTG